MPELPEVELVARSLDRLVAGRRIARAALLRARLAPDTTAEKFAGDLASSRIRAVGRRGKHILFDLDNRRTLITHLRMSGRFMLLDADREDPRFTHAVFYFDDETRLVFQDQRHFGMMKVVESERLAAQKEIAKLAPEPLSDDFTHSAFCTSLKSSRRTIKEFLLDQTKVCGLGNIYAAEALFLAGVHPAARTHRLSRRRAELLYEMIRQVLQEAIDAGSTIDVDPENIEASYYGGGYGSSWRVYDRESEPCVKCERPIARIVQAGRSSYHCPHCQRR
ncbi:MAG: bifunctional DNA-formamidopyrimidine glycosylase/DNA-(apurinic or apyrimidinic site) lyase [Pyrinomonadaceae bacterium]